MRTLVQTDVFRRWFGSLNDFEAKSSVLARLRRLSLGNAGDARPVGQGISEMRIPYGPGYRVYFVDVGPDGIIVLNGGTKKSQLRDIRVAQHLVENL